MSVGTSTNYLDQLSAIRKNDEKALRLLYQSNYPKVQKFVLDNNGNTDEAKDIFQEAFISCWRNIQLDKFQPQHEAALDAYLFQIAKNKWLDRLRLIKKVQLVPITNESNGIGDTKELAEKEEQLIRSIKENFLRIGDLCRDTLQRFYYQRQSMQMIADAMGWTEATARNNKYRCLQQLRKLINSNRPNHE